MVMLEMVIKCVGVVMFEDVVFVGNLHLNISGETHSKELLNMIEPFVFEWTGLLNFNAFEFSLIIDLHS